MKRLKEFLVITKTVWWSQKPVILLIGGTFIATILFGWRWIMWPELLGAALLLSLAAHWFCSLYFPQGVISVIFKQPETTKYATITLDGRTSPPLSPTAPYIQKSVRLWRSGEYLVIFHQDQGAIKKAVLNLVDSHIGSLEFTISD